MKKIGWCPTPGGGGWTALFFFFFLHRGGHWTRKGFLSISTPGCWSSVSRSFMRGLNRKHFDSPHYFLSFILRLLCSVENGNQTDSSNANLTSSVSVALGNASVPPMNAAHHAPVALPPYRHLRWSNVLLFKVRQKGLCALESPNNQSICTIQIHSTSKDDAM
jgi:hypothetical protein